MPQESETSNDKPVDVYEIVALAKRLNITLGDMKEMSFVSLFNILYSSVQETDNSATQKDIDAFLR